MDLRLPLPELLEVLTKDNYCLMVDENTGVEHYDEQGNLLVVTDKSEKWIAVPNIEVIRKLYGLPPITDHKVEIKKEIAFQTATEDGNENRMVWMGQKGQRCQDAAKALINLVDSPKYQRLMNDSSTIKVKIWEKIATELQEQGYNIATSVKEAGLRTFQKWRNMERAYWKYKKNPDECGEEKRKKKPMFFDDMHSVLSKRRHKPLKRKNALCSAEVDIRPMETEETLEIGQENNYDDGSDVLLPLDAFRRSHPDLMPLSRDVVNLLVELVTSKYQCIINNNNSSQQMKIWESIYNEITAAGYIVAKTEREGAIKLGLKWKNIEKKYLKRRNKKAPKKIYDPNLRRSILDEISKKKLMPSVESMDLGDTSNSEERKLKDREIAPKAVEALLKLIDSERYQELFNGGGKKTSVWERIHDEMEAMGFNIPGESKRDKSQRLFQKWRNMKRMFIKYQMEKDLGGRKRKPLCYDLLLTIISKDILRETGDVNTVSGIRESRDVEMVSESSAQVNSYHIDHDYQAPEPEVEVVPIANQSKSDVTALLIEIKNLHENALAVQQDNLSKVVTLLEEQLREQKTLNSLFTQYVVNSSKKSRSNSKNRSKEPNSSHFNDLILD